jgi:hypothetical protein
MGNSTGEKVGSTLHRAPSPEQGSLDEISADGDCVKFYEYTVMLEKGISALDDYTITRRNVYFQQACQVKI